MTGSPSKSHPPSWGLALETILKNEFPDDGDILWLLARAAENDPIKMRAIAETCTLKEIVASLAIRIYDSSFEGDSHGRH